MRKTAVWAMTLALGGAVLAGPARTAAALAPGLAPARLPASVSALYRPATFVHMVGRVYHIEKWVAEDLEGTLVDIIPIFHEGNPAFRVIYIPKDETAPKTVIVMAGQGFEHDSIAPVTE